MRGDSMTKLNEMAAMKKKREIEQYVTAWRTESIRKENKASHRLMKKSS